MKLVVPRTLSLEKEDKKREMKMFYIYLILVIVFVDRLIVWRKSQRIHVDTSPRYEFVEVESDSFSSAGPRLVILADVEPIVFFD